MTDQFSPDKSDFLPEPIDFRPRLSIRAIRHRLESARSGLTELDRSGRVDPGVLQVLRELVDAVDGLARHEQDQQRNTDGL